MVAMEHGNGDEGSHDPVAGMNGRTSPDLVGGDANGPGKNGLDPLRWSEGVGPGRTKPRQTADEQFLESTELAEPYPRNPQLGAFTHTESWRVLRIQGEFVSGINALAEVGAAVERLRLGAVRRVSPDVRCRATAGRAAGGSRVLP